MERAQEAQGEKAHVAVVTNYRNAVDCAQDRVAIEAILATAIEYASTKLKKATDQEAVYAWAEQVVTTRLPESGLDVRIHEARAKQQEGGGSDVAA